MSTTSLASVGRAPKPPSEAGSSRRGSHHSSRRTSVASSHRSDAEIQPTGSIKDLKSYIGSNSGQERRRKGSDGSQTARGRIEGESADGSVALSSRVQSRLSRQESRISAYGPGGSRNKSRSSTRTGLNENNAANKSDTSVTTQSRKAEDSMVSQLRLATENDRALIEQLRGKIELLQETIVQEEYHNQAIQRNYEKMSMLRKQTEDEMKRVGDELKASVDNANALQAQLKEMQRNAITQKQAQEMREKNAALTEQVAALTEKAATATQRQRMLEVQNHELERENETLKHKLRTQRLTLEGKIDELKSDSQQASHRQDLILRQHDEAQARAKQLEIRKHELEDQLDQLEQKFAEADSNREEAESRNSALREEKKKLAQALQAANQRCQTTLYKMKGEFESRVMQERARIAAGVEDKMQETEELSLANARLLDEKEQLADQVQDLETRLETALGDATERTNSHNHERDRLQRALDESQMRMEEAHASQRADLNNALSAERERYAELEAETERVRTEQKELYENKIQALALKEKEMYVTIGKLLNAEEALESAFTCLNCFKLFDQAVTCIPCGHSYCTACMESLKSAQETSAWCPECPDREITHAMPNVMLDNLVGKFVYKKQALQSLKEMTQGDGKTKQ